jgi:hypothetical protein
MTKEQFDLIYEQYQPSKFVKFVFRYFSKEIEKKDLKINNTISYLFLVLFLGGFLGTILKAPKQFIGFFAIIFSILLSILVIGLFIAGKLNDKRLNKISKAMNLTKYEYDKLVEEFYPSK